MRSVNHSKFNFFPLISIFSIVLLMVINVFMSARVAKDGVKLQALTKSENIIALENQQLESIIVAKTAFHDLKQAATENGYVSPEKIIDLSYPTVALR